MIEIKTHKIYELLKNKYSRVCCDYVLLSLEKEYKGLETHEKAVIKAFEILNNRFAEYDIVLDMDLGKMSADKSSLEDLLDLPSQDYFLDRKKKHRSYTVAKPIPYWYAFFEPPSGTPYDIADFKDFHQVLFPNRAGVEIYRWKDDFSNYFDAGKEGWGTGFWTVYDENTDKLVVIGASLTD